MNIYYIYYLHSKKQIFLFSFKYLLSLKPSRMKITISHELRVIHTDDCALQHHLCFWLLKVKRTWGSGYLKQCQSGEVKGICETFTMTWQNKFWVGKELFPQTFPLWSRLWWNFEVKEDDFKRKLFAANCIFHSSRSETCLVSAKTDQRWKIVRCVKNSISG